MCLVGRPKVISRALARRIRVFVDKFRKTLAGLTAAKIKRHFGLKCSLRTVQRLIRSFGYKSCYRRFRAASCAADRQLRRTWAQGRHCWGTGNRGVHMYMDCKFFRLPLKTNGPTPGSNRVWRRPGEADEPWAVRQSRGLKAPGSKVFAGFGNGRVIFATTYEKFTGSSAAGILRRSILPGLRRAYPGRSRFRVLMDGDPNFRARVFTTALQKANITKVTIPPRSGDLNPIETMWAHVARDLQAHVTASRHWRNGVKVTIPAKKRWRRVVLRITKKRNHTTLTRLAASMPKRVQAVRRNGGGPSGW
jgi:hypothetical protein